MESLKDKIAVFLAFYYSYGVGSGIGSGGSANNGFDYGCGDGSGSGYAHGWGCGSGYGPGAGYGSNSGSGYAHGSGSGMGYGSSDGYGSGSGMGSDITSYNGNKVYLIDGVQTIIRQVRDNIAKGAILNSDLTLTPCYVVKEGNTFAHGETLHKAMEALRDKLFKDMSEEERIAAFIEEHKAGVKYPVSDLYNWHHRLTGSCEMGRKAFAKDHGIDLDHDKMTVEEFVKLTENAYGGGTIRKLRKAYGKE